MIRISIFALFFSLQSLAWIDIGHEVVAQIAWRNLDASTKEKVSMLLKELRPIYKEAESFAAASTLPDHMRTGFKIFDTWHYVTLPLQPSQTKTVSTDKHNVLWALCECIRNLKPSLASHKSSSPLAWSPKPFERAFMLPFFAHLVGDIHQPLHAATRYSAVLPDGDLGGNLFPVYLGESITNLHLYWDSGLGLFGDIREKYVPTPTKSPKTDELAESIMKEHPKKQFGKRIEVVVFREWALESNKLAGDVVYKLPEGSKPTKDYITKGQALSKERVALAGYRLAYLLKELLVKNGKALATGCSF